MKFADPPKEEPTDEPNDVVFNSIYGVRAVELNRPKKLNSLNASMARKIIPRLLEWEKSQLANIILMSGAGEKAFCAGGDVQALAEQNKTEEGQQNSSDYFALEYQLDHVIATYSKPYIAIMDGITMGGGVGLSVHAPIRIATERTVFAMPETTIGFFPDVGGSFFLPRLERNLGLYLALTSDRLVGPQVKQAGIATHYLDSSILAQLTTRLAELQFKDYASLRDRLSIVKDTLDEFVTELPHDSKDKFSANILSHIESVFGASTIEDIISRLETLAQPDQTPTEDGEPPREPRAPRARPSNTPTGAIKHALEGDATQASLDETFAWATSTLKTLRQRSPTSLKVTVRQMREGANWDILQTFEKEHAMASRFMAHPDFVEGVNARLKKPTREPVWDPSNLEDVRDEDVERFFVREEWAERWRPLRRADGVKVDAYKASPHNYVAKQEKARSD